ncbi:MAG: glycosyl hydrolase 53 family protein [Bacteroidota bacterium]
MKQLLLLIVLVLALGSCEDHPPRPNTAGDLISYDTIKAWDITTYAAYPEPKPSFYDSIGQKINLVSFAKTVGVNTLRLRVLTGKPEFPHATVAQLLQLAKEAYAQKLAIWIDFHYSDVWADPGNQTAPKQWEGLSLAVLSDSVKAYSQRIIQRFVDQGTPPAIVQVGNEISPGMLWPVGKFTSSPSEAANVVMLFQAGANGVKAASPKTKIMVHLAGNSTTLWWLGNQYLTAGMQFDVWGLSYYGNWHGCDAKIFTQTCQNLGMRNGKPFIIAETAHPFTLGWHDNTGNIFGDTNQLCATFTATPAKQRAWLEYTWNAGAIHSQFRGMGYWEPAWVTEKIWGGLQGSSWENMALFDFNHKALSAAYFPWR